MNQRLTGSYVPPSFLLFPIEISKSQANAWSDGAIRFNAGQSTPLFFQADQQFGKDRGENLARSSRSPSLSGVQCKVWANPVTSSKDSGSIPHT